MERDGTISWSLGDRQGSVVDLVDEDGTVLNHFVYDSFGNRTQTSGVEFRYGYTGRELDGETGLYYYRARYYEPITGRFISEDPIGFGAGDTNLYRYVNNSPTNYTDPSGTIIPQIIGGFISGGIDLSVQLWNKGGDFSKVDWVSVGVNTAIGAATVGLGSFITKGVTSFGTQAVLNAGVAFNLGYYGKVTQNTIKNIVKHENNRPPAKVE